MTTADVGRRLSCERALSEVFSEVLNEPRVAPEADFFASGGDSLLAAILVARARRAGIAISLEQLLRHPTPRELAAVAGTCTPAAPVLVPAYAGRDAPLLPFQDNWLREGAETADQFVLGALVESRYPVDPDALAAALAAVVAHHDGLRLRLARVDGVWRQRVVRREPGPLLTVVPLVGGPEEQAALVQEQTDRLTTNVDVTAGPLIQAAFFPGCDGTTDRLLLVVHHFGIDAVSFALLIEDLATAYVQIRAGKPTALPSVGTSVVELAHRLARYWDTAAGRTEARYWAAQSARLPELPADRPRTTIADRSGSISIDLEAGALAGRGAEVVLGTLAYAFCRVTGRELFLARLTHHGRTQLAGQVDLSRTIGWLATQIPVVVDLPGTVDAIGAVRATRSALAALPNAGLGYFPLAQWLPGADGDLVRNVRRNIDFTVNLQRETAPARHTLLRPCATQPRFFRGHAADVPSLAVYGHEDVAEKATYSWCFDPRMHDAAVVADLAEAHRAALLSVSRYAI